MLMTYEDGTSELVGQRAERWTQELLERLQVHPTASGKTRRLTGHFSFDFIVTDEQLYPIECNARVHTAIVLLPVDKIASCYTPRQSQAILRPFPGTTPRSWIYNDLIMRYLPIFVRDPALLERIHPSLPACTVARERIGDLRPCEKPFRLRVDPTLDAEDWLPFVVLWHLYWPALLLTRWWQGKRWTRVSSPGRVPVAAHRLLQLNVSTGRIFEA